MENNSKIDVNNPNSETTRAGGPDDTRELKDSDNTQKSEEIKKEDVVWR